MNGAGASPGRFSGLGKRGGPGQASCLLPVSPQTPLRTLSQPRRHFSSIACHYLGHAASTLEHSGQVPKVHAHTHGESQSCSAQESGWRPFLLEDEGQATGLWSSLGAGGAVHSSGNPEPLNPLAPATCLATVPSFAEPSSDPEDQLQVALWLSK